MSPVAPTVGWIGLGRMGARMARRISEHHRVLGFDLAGPKALETSLGCSSPGAPAPLNSKLNIDLAASPGEVFRRCNVVFCALPTSNEVAAIAQQAVEAVRDVRRDEAERLQSESRDNGATSRGQQEKILVDCSSGDCMRTREIGEFLHTEANIAMFDCPVSGGPIGAAAGTLCAMIGGGSTTDSAELLYNSRLEPLIALFAREKRFFVGPLGSAHAVKSINNLMNATHLIAGVEGLLALQKFGISPERALACINGSSGRSLQTEVRIPKEVLTRRFNYGFQYSLMEKDCRQGLELVRKMEIRFPLQNCSPGESGGVLSLAAQLFQNAEVDRGLDYTRIAEILEQRAGQQLVGQDAGELLTETRSARSGASGGSASASSSEGKFCRSKTSGARC